MGSYCSCGDLSAILNFKNPLPHLVGRDLLYV